MEQFTTLVRNPCYERHIIVNENVCIVVLNNPEATVLKPYYIGFSILEISKFIMYDFYYNILQKYFGYDGIQLLYSDTDSLALNIKTYNILDDLKNLSDYMDFSNLHENHPLFSLKNHSELFKFKEEFALKPISRLCALKSKVYSFEVLCSHNEGIGENAKCIKCGNSDLDGIYHVNKLKGIQKRTAREIHFYKYLNCLNYISLQRENVYQISSKSQHINSTIMNKITLSSFDDKRFIYNCGIHSEPFSYNNKNYCDVCMI